MFAICRMYKVLGPVEPSADMLQLVEDEEVRGLMMNTLTGRPLKVFPFAAISANLSCRGFFLLPKT
jgi:hypothetical protein